MTTSSSSVMQSSYSGLHLKPGLRSKPLAFNPIADVSFSRSKINPTRVACNLSLRGLGTSLIAPTTSKTKRNFVVYCNVEGANPLPSGPPSGAWKTWVVGIVISVIIPICTGKLGPLGVIKNKFDTALQNVENIVETVEKVAGGIEKAAENLMDNLPDGQLKKAIGVIEHIAERAAKDADTIDDFIDEFQEKEEKIEDCIEQAVEKAEEKKAEDAEEKKAEDAEEKKAEQAVEKAEDAEESKDNDEK